MSDERKNSGEAFVNRWSRLKAEARESAAADQPPLPAKPAADDPLPELPPIEELTLESDFSGFFHPKVGEDVRRAALRKLFSEPHFNVMDGLDVYIDDYSKTEPIPAAMLASLRQAQRILEWAADTGDKREADRASETADPAVALQPHAALEEPAADPLSEPAADPVFSQGKA